ncbi:unnamed protein product, partial [marine sediment metagenome]
DHIHNAPENQCEKCDNFDITKDKGLQTRYGYTHYDATNKQPVGSDRVDSMIEFKDEILLQADDAMFKDDSTHLYLGKKRDGITLTTSFATTGGWAADSALSFLS